MSLKWHVQDLKSGAKAKPVLNQSHFQTFDLLHFQAEPSDSCLPNNLQIARAAVGRVFSHIFELNPKDIRH